MNSSRIHKQILVALRRQRPRRIEPGMDAQEAPVLVAQLQRPQELEMVGRQLRAAHLARRRRPSRSCAASAPPPLARNASP